MPKLFLSLRESDDSQKLEHLALAKGWQVQRIRHGETPLVKEAIDRGESVACLLEWMYCEKLKQEGVKLLEPDPELLVKVENQFVYRTIRVSDIQSIDLPAFIKPLDGKGFDAQVIQRVDSRDMLEDIYGGEFPILESDIVNFLYEYRFWVLDGKIITFSRYKPLDQKENPGAWRRQCWELAEQLIQFHAGLLPRSVVIDIGIADVRQLNGKKSSDPRPMLIEANPVTSSGIYQADPGAVLKCLTAAMEGS